MAALPSLLPTESQLAPVRAAIINLLPQPDYDDGSFGPLLVRLAWHAAGTYCAFTSTGGSNGGGMRFKLEGDDPSNAGLAIARDALDRLKRENGLDWMSYADLYTFAGAVAILALGGPEIKWWGGRTDFADAQEATASGVTRGRLPDASQGATHLRHIFYRMGFNDRDIVALSGAHCLGRCHKDRSGFDGKWVNNPTRFSNAFFRTLIINEWKCKLLSNGLEQYSFIEEDIDGDGEEVDELMMLPSDMALLEDPKFSVWVSMYAKDSDLFFRDFADAFSRLLELGLKRNTEGIIVDRIVSAAGIGRCPMRARL